MAKRVFPMGPSGARVKPPCKDCTERHRACHDECERYAEFKAELARIRDAKIEDAKQFAGLEISKDYKPRRNQR